MFVTGTGDFVNVGDRDSNAPGYDITTGDSPVRADYRVCDNFAIGIDGGYSSSRADLVDNGRIDTDGGKIGAYATWFGKGFFGSKFYVDGTVGGGLNNYDTRRTGLQNEFVRETNGPNSMRSSYVRLGLDLWLLQHRHLVERAIYECEHRRVYRNRIDRALDHRGSGREFIPHHHRCARFYDIKAGHVLIRPEVRAAYQHEYCDGAYQVGFELASWGGQFFRVRGPRIGRDAALVDAGVNVQWNNRLATCVCYDCPRSEQLTTTLSKRRFLHRFLRPHQPSCQETNRHAQPAFPRSEGT